MEEREDVKLQFIPHFSLSFQIPCFHLYFLWYMKNSFKISELLEI